MSIAIMVLGQSGTGKSTSLRNMNPEQTLLIQAVKKPLPFKSKAWTYYDAENNPKGNMFVTDNSMQIVKIMQQTKREIIIIDDFQYILANEFMRRVLDKETGNAAFAKYNEIARNAWDILMTTGQLDANKRVYILGHTQEDENGRIKAKTIGKLLDEKITVEGLVTLVLRTHVINGNYIFSTKNNGTDTVKTPLGMFDDEHIENDLDMVDKTIREYYDIK
jgi:hypothetical protein